MLTREADPQTEQRTTMGPRPMGAGLGGAADENRARRP